MHASKDGVSDSLLEILAQEQANEDVFGIIKDSFRKKKVDLNTYLETTREIAEQQFYNLAMKRKLLALLKQSS